MFTVWSSRLWMDVNKGRVRERKSEWREKQEGSLSLGVLEEWEDSCVDLDPSRWKGGGRREQDGWMKRKEWERRGKSVSRTGKGKEELERRRKDSWSWFPCHWRGGRGKKTWLRSKAPTFQFPFPFHWGDWKRKKERKKWSSLTVPKISGVVMLL